MYRSIVFCILFTGVFAFSAMGEGKMVSFATPDGTEANAFVLSAKVPSSNYLFIFHEWWGLDDNTKKEALKYYNDLEGVTVMAIDLYDGVVAADEQEAAELMRGAVEVRMENIVKGAIKYAGTGAEIATLGWSFGATWALKTSIMLGNKADGCVMYYGMPVDDVEELKKLQTDVVFFFAKNDNWVTEKKVEGFRQNMKAAGRELEVVAFQAGQAFANPNDKRYNRIAAEKSYRGTLNYLREKFEN